MNQKWPRLLADFQAIRSLPISEFEDRMCQISLWLLENLKHDIDYEWSLAQFTTTYHGEVNSYPDGVFFNSEEDMVAFKLTFGL